MTITDFRNFDVLITRSGAQFRAFLVDAPAGEASTRFELPFTAEEVKGLGGLALGLQQRGAGVTGNTDPAADLAALGGRLFEAVFGDELRARLAASLASTAEEGAGLRLRLRFEEDAADLALLPWEILYDQGQQQFVGLAEASPILRYLSLPRSRSALLVEPPLRVLAVLSSPTDLPPLEIDKEWQAVQEALAALVADGKLTLERLARPTLAALQERLMDEQPVHILHVVGHGEAGRMLLEDGRGRSQPVWGEDLAALLRNHHAVRLVYLSACEGALSSGQSAFAGVAQALVRGGAPAAVAMQAEISDSGAIELARTFYTALAAGRPVDAALTQARAALSAAGSLEWAIPVLFSRSPDNRLFDLRQVLPTPDCPYPGMVPFSEAQQDLFFGRNKEIEEALERLRQYPFLAVVGPSGSGKSSLVYAGAIPALRKTQRFGPGQWTVKTMRPSDSRTTDGSAAPRQALAGLLDCAPDAIAHQIFEQRTLLVVDQFEELFTLAEADEAQGFLDALQALMARPKLYILLTARADFYPELMACSLWPAIRANRLELTPLGDDALWAAIVEPAAHVGVSVDESLAVQLIADASGQSGVLPLVQETLRALWDKVERRELKLAAYRQMADGGRSGLQVAMDRRASAVYENLPEGAKPVARRIFLRLIQFGEGRADTRRQQTVDELRARGDDAALFDETLGWLVENRLLTASGEAGGARRVDIAHEALIAGWPRLQEWLGQRRAAEQIRRQLEAKAVEWVRSSKRGGLLDEYELQEAEHWLASEDAEELGYSEEMTSLVEASKTTHLQTAAKEEEAKRTRQRSRLLALGLAIAVGVVALVGWFWQQSRIAEATAVLAKAEAERLARRVDQLMTAMLALRSSDDAPLVLLLNVERLRTYIDRDEAINNSAQSNMYHLLQEVGGTPLSGHRGSVSAAAFSPDGRWLATASFDGTARLWDMAVDNLETQSIVLVGHDQSKKINDIAFSPDGRWLVTGSQDTTARLWDTRADDPTQAFLELAGHSSGIIAVGFSPDGHWLATGDADGIVRLWDMTASDPRGTSRELTWHTSSVIMDLAFSSDGRWLATGSLDGTARLWGMTAEDPNTGPYELGDNGGGVWAVAFHPTRPLLVTSAFGGRVRLWDASADNPRAQPLELGDAGRSAAVFSPDGRWLATAYGNDSVRLWELTNDDPDAGVRELRGHKGLVSSIAFSADGHWLVTASYDRTARLWDLTADDPRIDPITLSGHSGLLTAVVFSPDGRHIVTTADDGAVRLWDTVNLFAQPVILSQQTEDVIVQRIPEIRNSIALSPDRRWLASASGDGTIHFWDIATHNPTHAITMTGVLSPVLSLEYSADGRWLAAGVLDGSALLWDLTAAGPASEPIVRKQHDQFVWDVALSPNGQWLATVTPVDSTVRLWDIGAMSQDPQPIELTSHTGGVWAATFSPDNRWLATVGSDRSVLLWDMAALDTPPLKLDKPRDATADLVFSSPDIIDFSSDGRWLATALGEGIVRLWDMAALGTTTPSDPIEFVEPNNEFTAVAFSDDSQYLAIVSIFKTVRMWDLKGNIFEGEPVEMVGFSSRIDSVAFGSDGRWLATGVSSGDVELRQWRVEDLIDQACRTAGRNLTVAEWASYMGDGPYRPTCPQWPAAE